MKAKEIEAIYALSPMQHGMLFHSLLDPESGVYHAQMTCLLEGNLDVQAFRQAWQHVVDRHPALRTAYAWRKLEKPLQAVKRSIQQPIEIQDWSALS